jgi:cell division septum initiation protein DivIVA
MENVTSNVKSLEAETEKIIEEAKAMAQDILRRSKKEAGDILSAEFPLEDARAEHDRIIAEARAEAEKRVELSREKASEIDDNTERQIEKIVDRIVNIVVDTEQL